MIDLLNNGDQPHFRSQTHSALNIGNMRARLSMQQICLSSLIIDGLRRCSVMHFVDFLTKFIGCLTECTYHRAIMSWITFVTLKSCGRNFIMMTSPFFLFFLQQESVKFFEFWLKWSGTVALYTAGVVLYALDPLYMEIYQTLDFEA